MEGKAGCDIAITKVSVSPAWSSGPGMTLQSCPRFGQSGQAFVSLLSLVSTNHWMQALGKRYDLNQMALFSQGQFPEMTECH